MALNAPIRVGFATAVIVLKRRRCLIMMVNVLMTRKMRKIKEVS